MDIMKIAIIGAGHGGTSMAAHLSLMGAEVNLCDMFPEYLEGIKNEGGIHLEGVCENGFARLDKVTDSIEEAIKSVHLIMVVTPSFTHSMIAEACCKYLENGQVVVLNPGRTGGALEFANILNQKGVKKDLIIAETQTLIYAARKTGPATAKILAIKNEVDVACVPSNKIDIVMKLLNEFYPQFKGVENVLYTSLTNIGAIFHPTPVLLNMGRIETKGHSFEYYMEGITPSVARMLKKIDQERMAVAEGLGIKTKSVCDWLREAYGVSGDTLYELLQNNEVYTGILGPDTIQVRYITEDVPMGLVPISELGKKAGVETPLIDALISLSSFAYERDFRKEGRTLKRLGLDEAENTKIIELIENPFI